MNRSTKISTSAFILIGGQSKRFGYPKWKSKIGEKTLLDHIYNMCSLFDDTFIIGKKSQQDLTNHLLKINLIFKHLLTVFFQHLVKLIQIGTL